MTAQIRLPALHGAQHLPNGSDPIPGLSLNGGGGELSYPDYVRSLSSLLGYWRLGEPASPFADSSGRYPAAPGDATLVARGTAATLDQPGALPAADDDGAILFNAAGAIGDYLDISPGTSGRYDFNGNGPFTVAAWVKVKAHAGTWTAAIIHNRYSDPPEGWALQINYPARTVSWYRKDVGGTLYHVTPTTALTVDTWYHIVGVYDATAGKMELFFNGVSVGTQTGVTGGLPQWNMGPQIGGGAPNASVNYFFTGTIDEVAIWDAALAASDITGLYEAGATTSTPPGGTTVATDPIWDAKGDLAVGTAPDTADNLPVGSNGQILTADSAAAFGIKWAAAPAGGIPPSIVDAAGDLIVGTGPDTVARLPKGTAGQWLKTANGGLAWAGITMGDVSGVIADGGLPARLRAVGPTTPGNDFNNAVENGWYYGAPGHANMPLSTYGALMVINTGSTAMRQIFYPLNTIDTYQRENGGVGWSAWQRSYPAAPPTCVVGHSVSFPCPPATTTTLPWNTTRFNSGCTPDGSTKITVSRDGVYEIGLIVQLDQGLGWIDLYKSSAGLERFYPGNNSQVHAKTITNVQANDYFQLVVYNSAAVTAYTVLQWEAPKFWVSLVTS